MKRLGLLFLIVLLALTLCGCGEKDENAGLYHCVEVRSGEEPLELADSVLNLDQGGYGELTIRGEQGAVRWTREGSELRVDVNGQVLAGTIENGLVSLEIPENITLVYAREDRAESYLAERAAERERQALLQAAWDGDWYGWWHIRHATGDWAGKYGYFWDCCAEIGEDGLLLLWDETLPKDNFLAETRLVTGENGISCRGGSMLDRELEPENWELLVSEDKEGRLLTIRGRYDSVKTEGGFSYEIFLRPWGSEWPGSANEVPYYYEDWYLPLIRAGKEMPDTIGP